MKSKMQTILTAALLFLVPALLTSCPPPGAGGTRKPVAEASPPADGIGITSGLAVDGSAKVPVWGYAYGTGVGIGDEVFLKQEYEEWKTNYLVSAAVGKRIQRDYGDGMTPYDTVSEGQAYGMLLAVYFDDQATFDQLLAYALAHRMDGNTILMHWLVNRYDVNISEFGHPIPHNKPYYRLSSLGANRYSLNLATNGKPRYFLQNGDTYTDQYGTSVRADSGTPFIPACENTRSVSNATDADLDMATSLIFAAKRWGNGGNAKTYAAYASDFIKAILGRDVENGYVKAGVKWGGASGWNPSYYMPAYFRLFEKFMCSNAGSATVWASGGYGRINSGVLSNMDAQMAVIHGRNSPAGLYPDWVNTGAGRIDKATNGDRMYFSIHTESTYNVIDDLNGDGRISESDLTKMQSVNFYYDAVRVPWRMAMDYAWYGTARSKEITDKIAAFFHGDISTFVDGYAADGSPWSWANRDGFNNARPPASRNDDNPSITFLAMLGTAQLAYDRNEAKIWYDKLKTKSEPAGDYHYYGNTLRLMSLLYLSGYMVNLWESKYYSTAAEPVIGKYYRIRNRRSPERFLFLRENDGKLVVCARIEDDPADTGAIWKVSGKQVGQFMYRVISSRKQISPMYTTYLRAKTDGNLHYQVSPSTTNDYYFVFEPAGNGYYRIKNIAKNQYVYMTIPSDACFTESPSGTSREWEFELVE